MKNYEFILLPNAKVNKLFHKCYSKPAKIGKNDIKQLLESGAKQSIQPELNIQYFVKISPVDFNVNEIKVLKKTKRNEIVEERKRKW